MPELTPEQVAEQFTSAWNWEWNRRSAARGGLLVEPSTEDIVDINHVAAMAVARLQFTVAAPARNDDPTVLRLQRTARHLDHVRHQLEDTGPIRTVVDLMYSSIVALTTVGVEPAEWQKFAAPMIEAAMDLAASVVHAGHAKLMPAESDHD